MASMRDGSGTGLRQATPWWYAQWRAKSDQLQAEREGEARSAQAATQRAIDHAEGEYRRDMDAVGANGPDSLRMVEELLSTKKDLKIKESKGQLAEKLTRIAGHYDKLLLDHTIKFSDLMMEQVKASAASTVQQNASAAGQVRLPPSPMAAQAAQSPMPAYARHSLGSNTEARPPPVRDHGRSPLQQQPPVAFRGAEYGPYGAEPRPFRQGDYARHPDPPRPQPTSLPPPGSTGPPTGAAPGPSTGPPPGPSGMPHGYSIPPGPERQLDRPPRWMHKESSYYQSRNGYAVDERPRVPVVPSQQQLLPSTAVPGPVEPGPVAPQRAMEPPNATGGASSYQRLQFRNVEDYSAKAQKSKRKSDAVEDGQAQQQQPPLKKTRSLGTQPAGDKAPTATPTDKPRQDVGGDGRAATPTARPVVKRTIDFNEVYQDGDAEYKHIIFMYPAGDSGGNWYILKCDEHGVHFNTNPLHGAAKHLHSNQHNNMSKEHSLAIRELGHLVWDCTKELADKNNAAVKKAFENGYKPFNRNQLSKTERKSMGFAEPDVTPARKAQQSAAAQKRKEKMAADSTHGGAPGSRSSFIGLAYPVDGELYLAYWSKTKTNYAVLMLPWGDLYPSTGLTGDLLGTGLLDKPPKCYTYGRGPHGREISGWAEGYEDGGRLVTKREFPVMYFDNAVKGSVGWVTAKNLSRFNFEDPDWKSIPHYNDARNRYAAVQPQRFTSYQHMREYYEAHGLHLKQFSDTRDPPPADPAPEDSAAHPAAGDGGSDGRRDGNGPDTSGNKFPETEDPDEGEGRGGPDDVDMGDAGKDGEVGSDRESEPSEAEDSDDDVDMGNAESRRTSVSNKGSGENDGPGKQGAGDDVGTSDGPAVSGDADVATTTRASPEHNHPMTDGAQDKGRNQVDQTTEDTSTADTEAVGGAVSRIGVDASPVRSPSFAPSRARESSSVDQGNRAPSRVPSEPKEGAHLKSTEGAMLNDKQKTATSGVPQSTSNTSSATSSPPSPLNESTPGIAAAETVSGTSTPTVVHPDKLASSDRWCAVRSESHRQATASPVPQPDAAPAKPTVAASDTKEPAPKETSVLAAIGSAKPTPTPASRTSSPHLAKPSGEVTQVFEIGYYEDDAGGKFQKQKDGPYLRLVVDKASNKCLTDEGQQPGCPEVSIHPDDIKRLQVDPLYDSPISPCMITLEMKDGVDGPKKLQLVFDTSKIASREEVGKIHARRFSSWAKRVNAAFYYQNNTFNSSRPATGYTPN